MAFEIAGLIAAGAAVIGLIFTAFQIRSSTHTRQLELLDTVYHDIHRLEQDYYEKYEDAVPDKQKGWHTLFFQQLEWFAFLINNKKINDEQSINYFKKAFIVWCEHIFADNADQDEVDNPEIFEEMKKLYATFTGKTIQKKNKMNP
ncbi:MAG: hypothetical protein OEL81_00250 [Nitrosopumilus sp.]|nr:hypothetical protein [Nitrosopumilus sp.]